MRIQPIHHTFAPLALPQQQELALHFLLRPWRWRAGRDVIDLRASLTERFRKDTYLFDSGRSALAITLRALELQPGDEVIIQAYTCVVVPNAVVAAGGRPIYADIDKETLNMDPEAVGRVITPRTRAIICQHTFGIPADTPALRQICNEHQLALIEDCAHVMPENNDAFIGKYGDVIVFSFGRDKAISGVAGGAVLTAHPAVGKFLSLGEQQAADCSRGYIFSHLLYPLLYAVAKKWWPKGKILLRVARTLHLLPPVVTKDEKRSAPAQPVRRLANGLAALALQQFKQLPQLNEHRQRISSLYSEAAQKNGWMVPRGIFHATAPQKFPIFTAKSDAIRANLKSKHMYLDDGWCGNVINPRSVDEIAAGYVKGTCAVAEEVAKLILNLPTHPTMGVSQAQALIATLEKE